MSSILLGYGSPDCKLSISGIMAPKSGYTWRVICITWLCLYLSGKENLLQLLLFSHGWKQGI